MKLPELVRAAFVIGRRDFTATVFSKAFLLFLLGPLFPLAMGVMFGGVGARIASDAAAPIVAVIMDKVDFDRMATARQRLLALSDERPPVALEHVIAKPGEPIEPLRQRLLTREKPPVLGVIDGTLEDAHFTGAVSADGRTVRQLGLLLSEARRDAVAPPPARTGNFDVTLTERSSGSLASARALTARGGQALLFLLTLLLAGMLLSQLIEEKSNKVIEVLAAAVPVDAIFLGKLFAMLAMSLVGIALWTTGGAVAIAVYAKGGLASIPAPAVGWTLFLVLLFAYFAMSYLLIGAAFLGIGAQASTVREVQTLSMPVTMGQVMLFGIATAGVGNPGGRQAIGAAIFPFSSPFAMIARAAEEAAIWPHLLALAWQALWVALILRLASALFRRSVLKSGPAFRWPWQRRQDPA